VFLGEAFFLLIYFKYIHLLNTR